MNNRFRREILDDAKQHLQTAKEGATTLEKELCLPPGPAKTRLAIVMHSLALLAVRLKELEE